MAKALLLRMGLKAIINEKGRIFMQSLKGYWYLFLVLLGVLYVSVGYAEGKDSTSSKRNKVIETVRKESYGENDIGELINFFHEDMLASKFANYSLRNDLFGQEKFIELLARLMRSDQGEKYENKVIDLLNGTRDERDKLSQKLLSSKSPKVALRSLHVVTNSGAVSDSDRLNAYLKVNKLKNKDEVKEFYSSLLSYINEETDSIKKRDDSFYRPIKKLLEDAPIDFLISCFEGRFTPQEVSKIISKKLLNSLNDESTAKDLPRPLLEAALKSLRYTLPSDGKKLALKLIDELGLSPQAIRALGSQEFGATTLLDILTQIESGKEIRLAKNSRLEKVKDAIYESLKWDPMLKLNAKSLKNFDPDYVLEVLKKMPIYDPSLTSEQNRSLTAMKQTLFSLLSKDLPLTKKGGVLDFLEQRSKAPEDPTTLLAIDEYVSRRLINATPKEKAKTTEALAPVVANLLTSDINNVKERAERDLSTALDGYESPRCLKAFREVAMANRRANWGR